MTTTLTAAERLRLLLPLANNDAMKVDDVRQRLLGFLHNFEIAGLRVPKDAGMWDAYDDVPVSELKAVKHKLQRVCETGFLLADPGKAPRASRSMTLRCRSRFRRCASGRSVHRASHSAYAIGSHSSSTRKICKISCRIS